MNSNNKFIVNKNKFMNNNKKSYKVFENVQNSWSVKKHSLLNTDHLYKNNNNFLSKEVN